jgi:hypothetical protein
VIVTASRTVRGTGNVLAARAAYAYALVVAATLGSFLLGLPIQVSDSFGNMQQLSLSWSELLRQKFTQPGFLRPLLWAELKLVYDVSGGNFTAWFRWIHVAQVVALSGLFVALVRPRFWPDVASLPLAFAVLLGMHTFSGNVTEAFPTNMYLTVVILCIAAAVVALGTHRWWSDTLAVMLFVTAALTLETGLLVWVICIGAALIGARGISRPGLVVLTFLLGAYFFARFVVLGVGSPGLFERSSGFGFGVLEPNELVERFGANPLPFYAYNVVSSWLSVLLLEPSSGAYRATYAVTTGSVTPRMVLNAIAAAGTVTAIAWFVWVRRREWLAWRFEHDDRLVLLFGMVLTANAAISYPYSKDVVMGPAGVFLAVATAAAGRNLLAAIPFRVTTVGAVALVMVITVVTSAWSLRALGLFSQLRSAAVVERLDWAYIESDIAEGVVQVPAAEGRRLLETLRHEALIAHPAPPPLVLPFRAFLGD